MEQALLHAVEDKQFTVAYEPIVCSEKHHILGYSATMQWVHPDLGLQQNFNHLAAQAGVLPQIELQIVQQLLESLQLEPQPAVICLQICPQHLQSPLQFDRLHKVLLTHQQVLHRFTLGFAEYDLLKLNPTNLNYLHQLKRLGVRLALEQFGAEAMPLGIATQYPFDFVKLDPIFCRQLTRQPQKRQLLDMLLMLAQSHKFRLIADGVDDGDLRQLLIDQGCCYMQGRLVRHLLQPEQSVFLQQLA